ncbi:MAG: SRPBCC family protein [Aeromicrobium sp.]
MSSRSALRRRAAHLRASASAVVGIVRSPATRGALLATVVPRRSRKDDPPLESVTIPAPDGVAEFDRSSAAAAASGTPPHQLVAALQDLGRAPEWFTLHSAWRGDPPGRIAAGDTFAQQILLMDIPAEVRWTVVDVGPTGLRLRGTGPMGIVLGLWCTVAAEGAGSTVRIDVGADGPPLRGPVGTTVMRSIDAALRVSVDRIATMDAGGSDRPRWIVGDEPVLHGATGRLLDPRTPVVVGVGQVVQREPDGDNDPAGLAVQALRAAADDSGAGDDLLRAADAVYAIASASWTYRDQAALIADAVGATPAERVQSSPYGGDGSQLLVNEAAAAIAAGRSHIVLVAGAEAGSTLARLQKDGRSPAWPVQDDAAAPDRVVGIDRVANNDAETAVGLGAPVFMYALLESAVRRRRGHDVPTHRRAVAGLWSRMSAIAARNPYAWSPTAVDAEVLATATPSNRAVSEPYNKLLCANLQVDLASGIVVTSVAAAQAAGVPQDRWVFVIAGASAHDEWFVSERADLSTSPAIRAAGEAALDHAGLTIDEVEHIDLYSCFPSAVQIAADALGLPVDDPERPLSVTGGLTFAGGPGNSYGSHAIATLVPILRADPASTGLSTSLGWYATKHSVGLYSARPPEAAFAHLRPVVDRPPARRVLRTYDGDVVIEATTVPYDRQGAPEAAVLSTLTVDGDRVLIRTADPAVLALVLDGDPLGRTLRLAGDTVTVVRRKVAELPPPPPVVVRLDRDGAVAVVTLDRRGDDRAVPGVEQAIADAEADGRVRVIVLAGAEPGRRATKPLVLVAEGGTRALPVADLVVASDDAVFAGGDTPDSRLPHPVAMELALLGGTLSAQRLVELGLVNRVTAPGAAHGVALELARQVAARSVAGRVKSGDDELLGG